MQARAPRLARPHAVRSRRLATGWPQHRPSRWESRRFTVRRSPGLDRSHLPDCRFRHRRCPGRPDAPGEAMSCTRLRRAGVVRSGLPAACRATDLVADRRVGARSGVGAGARAFGDESAAALPRERIPASGLPGSRAAEAVGGAGRTRAQARRGAGGEAAGRACRVTRLSSPNGRADVQVGSVCPHEV